MYQELSLSAEQMLDARAVATSLDKRDVSAGTPVRLSTAQWASKLWAVCRMGLPLVIRRRRTVRGVGAYFDLITDDGRLFYGDSFHFGYYPQGNETFPEALDAHTDFVARLARVAPGGEVLDLGCGIGAPAARIARINDCHVTGVNISRE